MAKIVFAGSPAVAVPSLRALAAEHDVVLVITREDSPVGRRREITPTPVAVAAGELGLPVLKANSLRDVALPDSDFGVVVAYGGLVPDRLLDVPSHGWLNAHFSLLPRLRGAAPVQRGLWNGDSETGITVFRLVTELDAGPIIVQVSDSFLPHETSDTALKRLAGSAPSALSSAIHLLIEGSIQPFDQVGEPTFAPKFSKEEARIDWSLPTTTVDHRIRALTSEPGAFTELDGERVVIVQAVPGTHSGLRIGEIAVVNKKVVVGTADGSLELLRLKPAGKNEMAAGDWARGLRGDPVFE